MRTIQNRWLAIGLALLLMGVGLLSLAQGLGLLQRAGPTPTPTLQQRLIPTATSSREASALPSPRPSGAATQPVLPWIPVPTVVRTGQSPMPTLPPVTPTVAGRHTTAWALAPSTPTPADAPIEPPTLTGLPTPAGAPEPTLTPQPMVGLYSLRQRMGVVAPNSDVERYDMAHLGAGWYLQSEMEKTPPAGMESVLFAGLVGNDLSPDAAALRGVAQDNPGILWLVGNEPDVIWQTNATPQEYARMYHDTYTLLKQADPSCQVAIGGISQVTPLRLRYLDAVLSEYEAAYGQPMPVDVWNVHTAILREERGAWGVDIPPGLADDTGILYEIVDNADVEILEEQVWIFRRWMADRGLRDKQLIVSELSVLMPPDYGFPFERVRAFMIDAFDFFNAATDPGIGHPADGNRLVQRWAWYSVSDTIYSTGNLFDPHTGQITPLGTAFANYVSAAGP